MKINPVLKARLKAGYRRSLQFFLERNPALAGDSTFRVAVMETEMLALNIPAHLIESKLLVVTVRADSMAYLK